MQISKNIGKMFWLVADKVSFVVYGVATITLLQVTNSKELGLFTLFINLHNFMLHVAGGLGLQAIPQFSSNKDEIPLVNFYSLFTFSLATVVFIILLFLLQAPLSSILEVPRFSNLISAMPLLVFSAIPRYFTGQILTREIKIFRVFLMNFVYSWTMSGMIFYNVWHNNFLYSADIININYIGSILSGFVGIILSFKYLRFRLPKMHAVVNNTTIKYKDIIKFTAQFSITNTISVIPKQLDVYLVQFFFGIHAVGLYSPAKTMFRFVEDIMVAINAVVYSTVVKCFSTNDLEGVNSIISKTISILLLLFLVVTVLVWLAGGYFFPLFLPDKFANAYPIFRVLMLISVVLPVTLLNIVIAANNMVKALTKYAVISLIAWLLTFALIGGLSDATVLVSIPYIMFMLVFSTQLWLHASKYYGLQFKQIFRIIPDTYYFLQIKFNKYFPRKN